VGRLTVVGLSLSLAFIGQAPPAMAQAPAPAPASDSLGRENPRSAVTAFLEACRNQDYQKAAQYLDLRGFPKTFQQQRGSTLARQLGDILNSDPGFVVYRLSSNPEGSGSDKTNPNLEHILTINQNGQKWNIDQERVTLQSGGPQVWMFTPDTVTIIPEIPIPESAPPFGGLIPRFLVTNQFLATPLWKWIALLLLLMVIVALSRLFGWAIALVVGKIIAHSSRQWNFPWLATLIQPLRLIVALILFGVGLGIIGPSALSRIYIGRGMGLVFVGTVVWALLRLLDLTMNYFESRLGSGVDYSARTMVRLGRRTAAVSIVVVAILFVLESWGYNTSTLIAGLGVGGIAVALAAQQTIANVFGGVSLIGDHPIRIGEYGKFGDMEGVVEDIGMRSTRVRTPKRTIVSVPNSTFAGLNLENYSIRDKILFNPRFEIKRDTGEAQVHALIDEIIKLLSSRKEIEPVKMPARIVALNAASFTLEIFCYVRTADVNEFYRVQGDLLLALNDTITAAKVELV